MSTPYRTLFFGKLTQLSDFSTGGAEAQTTIDMPVLRDGKGRFVLRGTSLAGALTATAQKRYKSKLPRSITSKGYQDEDHENKPVPSNWILHNAHLAEGCKPKLMVRQQVKINEITGAQEEGALFDIEVLSHTDENGTPISWNFLMEVNTFDAKTDENAGCLEEQLAALALQQWAQQGAFLGRKTAAGLGWFKLENLQAIRLNTSQADQWPNAFKSPFVAAETLYDSQLDLQRLSASNRKQWQDAFGLAQLPANDWQTKRYRYTLTPGVNPDGYGLDGYLVGGHSVDDVMGLVREKLSKPPGCEPKAGKDNKGKDVYPEAFYTKPSAQPVLDANNQPYIPGSSIRGVFAHECWRLLSINKPNHKGITHRNNPEAQNSYNKLFGTTEESSYIFFSDARLKPGEEWKSLFLHNHAQDEFIGGVYGKSKHMRCAITSGELHGEIVINAPAADMPKHEQLLRGAIEMAQHGLLAVGSKQWVDSGWLTWTFEEVAEDTSLTPSGEPSEVPKEVVNG